MSAITFGTGTSTVSFGSTRLRAERVVPSRLRITRRGRAVLTFLIAAPLAIGAVGFGVGAVGAAAGTHAGTANFHYVTVQPGESLWQLAESIAPSADPRDVVADIQNLNNLSSGELQPGQQLAIPAKYER